MSAAHHGHPLLAAGEPLRQASTAMILVHGRGATAESILALANEFRASGMAFLAPQAAGNTWYPNSFLAPLHSNEPWLSAALDVLASVLERINTAGVPCERTILLGFSQGACLASEFVAATRGGMVGSSH